MTQDTVRELINRIRFLLEVQRLRAEKRRKERERELAEELTGSLEDELDVEDGFFDEVLDDYYGAE